MPTNSCSHDAWFVFSFPPIGYAHAAGATYVYMTNSLFDHVFANELDISVHLIANNDVPHRSLENREIHYRLVIFRQLKNNNAVKKSGDGQSELTNRNKTTKKNNISQQKRYWISTVSYIYEQECSRFESHEFLKRVYYMRIYVDVLYEMSLEWHKRKTATKRGKKEIKFFRNNIEHAIFWVIEWWSEWWFVQLLYNSFSFSRTFQDFERRGSMSYEFVNYILFQ